MATQILKTLQRVIFPSAVETDVVPLYVDAGVATGVQLPTRIDGDASTSGGDEHLRSVPNKCERKP